jgi:hypothetical protein
MDKRYQVFISSTFRDLVEERQAVLRAVLELDHMPAGMELFPAGDDAAWQLIKDVIDASDYYILIVGGRYGSLDATGLSFTEREYDHAVSTKKPVVPLLHKAPDNLPRGKTDTDPDSWAKLQAFRKKVETRHTCSYWTATDELKTAVILGLTSTTKRHPAVGWVRADRIPEDATVAEVLKLRERIVALEAHLEVSRTQPPDSARDLAQGTDTFAFRYSFIARRYKTTYDYDDTSYSSGLSLTWENIFAAVAPTLINEASDSEVRRGALSVVTSPARPELLWRAIVNFATRSSGTSHSATKISRPASCSLALCVVVMPCGR